MGARRKGRELAVQALYQIEIRGEASPASMGLFWKQAEAAEEARDFAEELVEGVRDRKEQIDAMITAASRRWRIERLPSVDLCILRVGAYELMATANPATAVILDEAIEISKRFGSEDSGTFVNGVLDHIAGQLGVRQARSKGEEITDG